MSATFEDLRVLKSAEEIADAIWKRTTQWSEYRVILWASNLLVRQIQSVPTLPNHLDVFIWRETPIPVFRSREFV